MDKIQQRIKIAEACGWDCDPLEARNWGSRGQWVVKPKDRKRELVSKNMTLPDYLNDLNAMHEAEKTLTYKQGGEMTVWIKSMSCAGYGPQLFATAEQRAEAFLRTIGLWET